MAEKRKGSAAGKVGPAPTVDRWLGLAERIAVDLFVLAMLLRTLTSSFEGGPGTEQAFAAGILAALVLGQRPWR